MSLTQKYQRASTEKLLEIFDKYASVEKNGQKYITHEDFMTKYLHMFPLTDYNEDSLHLLARIVNLSTANKSNRIISFGEFQNFEELLSFPDALYKAAFNLFDENGKGTITYDEFIKIMKKTELSKKIKFNEDNKFLELYFGKVQKKPIDYFEFRQLLHDFRKESSVQAFKNYDTGGKGYISVNDFISLMTNLNSHLLTTDTQMRLMELASDKGNRVSFPYFVAFDSMLNNMELIIRIYLQITNGHKNVQLSKEEFMRGALTMTPITPLQVDILYELCDTKQTGKIDYKDLYELAPYLCFSDVTANIKEFYYCRGPEHRTFLTQVLESVYRYFLGSIAGATGAVVIYPLDLVKTRLQNQRTGQELYKNAIDCLIKVVKNEGPFGLHKGLLPVVVGVAPEQAIKLTVNDFVRDKFTEKDDGYIPLAAEILAGGCAGFSQVVFTNPLEILKIRLQVAGEAAGIEKNTIIAVMKELGPTGLYKGVRACFIRDIPFSAIYFPVYANTKLYLADENGYNNKWNLIIAGLCAGIPPSWLMTPADVVKTRLQVAEREGRSLYKGVFHCARKILKEEGIKTFFTGALLRCLRIAPGLAITLTVYELLQRLFFVDFGGFRPAGSEIKPKKTNYYTNIEENPDHIGGYKAARPVFAGMETKFGLSLPKFKFPEKGKKVDK